MGIVQGTPSAYPSWVLLVLHVIGAVGTSGDCSLNGDLVDGKCVCDSQWSGSDCERLVLLPAEPTNGFNLDGGCAYRHGGTLQ